MKGLSAAALARVVRWWIVGLVSLGGDLGAIYLAHERLGLPLPVAALVAAEAIQLLRFLANDRWVFGHRRPTWTRLWQYHVACASGAALHWVVLNSLAWLGLYYLLATVAATGVTVSWSMLTNFGWVWRRHGK
ncbi:MAG: GtrA family protein [Chloroflexi bacterium]|nr:GtrA family protein [Chloroflexota bacterium]